MKTAENAVLVPGPSVAQFVIQELLKGVEVQVDIDGKSCKGYVHQLDFGKGADYVFANIWIEKESEDEPIDLKVGIYTNGSVIVLKN